MSNYVAELRSKIYGKYKSEAEFARSLGWSRQKLNKLTTGKKLPDIEELNQLSSELGIEVGELLHIFLRAKSTNEQQTA